jgi:hypothetical protein
MALLWPPLDPSDLPDRRRPGDPYHLGLMVTQRRAIMVATALFPDEIADGSDCRDEVGRVGLPCTYCNERNQAWRTRVRTVRAAMIDAMGRT